MNPSRALLIAALGLSAGCAPSLSTMQPAHIAPKGHVQATAGIEVSAPTATFTRVIDAGKALSQAYWFVAGLALFSGTIIALRRDFRVLAISLTHFLGAQARHLYQHIKVIGFLRQKFGG